MNYNSLFNPNNEYVFITDENKQILNVNNIVLENLGYLEEEILEKNILELFPSDRRQEAASFFNNIIEGNVDFCPIPLMTSDGKYIPVDLKICKMKSGKINVIFGINQDISDQAKIKHKLSISEKLYRNLFESSPFLIGLINKKGIIININNKVDHLLSMQLKQILIGKNFMELLSFHEKNKALIPIFEDYFKKIYNGEKSTSFDFKIYRVIGDFYWFRINSSLLKLEDEDILQFVVQDITDYKIAEQEFKESQEKFTKAFNLNALSMSICTMEEGRIIDVNEVFLNDLGYTREEVIGKTTKELNTWANWSKRALLLQKVEEKGSVSNLDIQFRTKAGEIRDGLFSVSKIILNNIPHFIVIANDITEMKIAEKRLKDSEIKFREAYNRIEFYKDIFTHDINNILQSILSADQIMMMLCNSKEEKEKVSEFLKIIRSQVDRGAKLVNNIQELSKLEDQCIILEKVEILSTLQKSINLTKNSFKDKNIQIQIDFNEDKLYLQANNLIQDVFENILINSIRFNLNNTIEIVIKISRIEEKGINYCKMEFIDNGIGIEDSRKNLVFSRAFQNGNNVRGIGLGLSLVNKIIQVYRGQIWVEDRVKGDYSKGSNFIILIPEV